jgi:hypothetical protein
VDFEFGPGQRGSAPGQAATEGDQQHPVAWLEGPAQRCLGEQDWYRGGGGVADFDDVLRHGIRSQAEPRGQRGGDARVRLVSDQAVNVAQLPAGRGQRLGSRGAHPLGRLPVNLASPHLEVPRPAVGLRPWGRLL